jgi:bifunctional oligoribonuclease and PAP phosphatase NrnA
MPGRWMMRNLRVETELIDGRIATLFQDARRILLASHVRPDGDAVGAVLGLGLALRDAGKQVQIVLSDGAPSSFHHLPGSKTIQRKAAPPWDLAISVDASDLPRTGDAFGGETPGLNIDHHVTNLNFGRVNLVDPSAEATCVILAERMPRWGLSVTKTIAECLLTGIIIDTIGFRTSNMTPKALRLAADLMETGANLPELYRLGLVSKTYEAARYWGCGLGRLQRENGLLWTVLRLSDRQEAGYNGNDDADLVNMLSSVIGDIVVLFNEQKDGRVKVSWRARSGLNVSNLALQFGGGGHPAAAGADITGALDEVQAQVLAATRAYLAAKGPAGG